MPSTTKVLYTPIAGPVNAEKQFATSADVEKTIPTLSDCAVDVDTMASTLYGQLQRALADAGKTCPASRLLVLRALLSFIRSHSDNVWPSEETLEAISGVKERTVRTCMKEFRDVLGIHKISVLERAAHKAGAWLFQGARRNPHCITPTYDLSAFRRWLPAALVAVFESWLSDRSLVQSALEAAKLSADSPVNTDGEPIIDPFADVVATAEPSPLESHQNNNAESNHSICNVDIELRGDPAGRKDAGTEAAGASAQLEVQRQKIADIDNSGKTSRKPRYGNGYAALRQLGVWVDTCRRIVEEHGERWAYMLSVYVRWRDRRKEIYGESLGAYARRTWEKWPESEGWGDPFLEYWRKCEEAGNAPPRTEAQVKKAPPKPKPADKAPTRAAEVVSTLTLEDLPAERVTALCQQAFEALRKLMPQSAATIQRTGPIETHPSIRARALKLLLEGS